jgi:hypothetical protein
LEGVRPWRTVRFVRDLATDERREPDAEDGNVHTKSPRRAPAAALLAAVIAAVPTGIPAQTAAGACPRPALIPAVGRACPVPGGYVRTLADGGILFTHGADPAPVYGADRYKLPGQIKPVCAKDPENEFYAQVLYARAYDRPDRWGSKLSEIRAIVATVNGILRREAARDRRLLSYRVLCTGREVSVERVVLSTRHAETDFFSIVDDLRAQGFRRPYVKYWIYYDGRPPNARAAGVGSVVLSDSASIDNGNNFGEAYAVNFGHGLYDGGPLVMMHENGHTMGAVQRTAPHTTGADHCTDGTDVMCYYDGGPHASDFSTERCSDLSFDCGHDDYFAPVARSRYIAGHWNLGSPLNRFLQGCAYASGVIAAGAPLAAALPAGVSPPEAAPSGTVARSHPIPPTCAGRPFVLSGVPLAAAIDAVQKAAPQGSGYVVTLYARKSLAEDFNVCFYAGAKLLGCFTASGTDRGTIPARTTRALIYLHTGAQGVYVLNAV